MHSGNGKFTNISYCVSAETNFYFVSEVSLITVAIGNSVPLGYLRINNNGSLAVVKKYLESSTGVNVILEFNAKKLIKIKFLSIFITFENVLLVYNLTHVVAKLALSLT